MPHESARLLRLANPLLGRTSFTQANLIEVLQSTDEGARFLEDMAAILGPGYLKKLVDRVRAEIRKRKRHVKRLCSYS